MKLLVVEVRSAIVKRVLASVEKILLVNSFLLFDWIGNMYKVIQTFPKVVFTRDVLFLACATGLRSTVEAEPQTTTLNT